MKLVALAFDLRFDHGHKSAYSEFLCVTPPPST